MGIRSGSPAMSGSEGEACGSGNGVALKIVSQGQAHTPGPNGAPPDDQTFNINASVVPDGEVSYSIKLEVTGGPDPNGGSVCAPGADGSQQTSNGQNNIGNNRHKVGERSSLK